MKLTYVAYDRAGRQVTDTIDAGGVAEANETLRRRGLYVASVSEGPPRGTGAPSERSAQRRPRRRVGLRRLKDLAMMMRQLHVLVSCGTPVVESLQALEGQSREGALRQAVMDVRRRVEEGASLSAAMETHPEYFDPVCRSLVAAGETSGNLAGLLDRLAVTTRKQLRIRNTLLGSMLYPALLLVVAVVVLALLLVFVVPRFAELFDSLDAPLPPTTEALLAVGTMLHQYWFLFAAAPVIGGIGLWLWLMTPDGRRTFDGLVLRLPQVGRMLRSILTARIMRLLGLLLESDVDVLDALTLTREAATNHHYAVLLEKARDAVTRGEPISSAFRDSRLVSPTVHAAIRSGEGSGQVGPMLVNLAEFLDEENEVLVRSVTSILEPLILILLGLLVGLVAVSLFLPLFDLTAMA